MFDATINGAEELRLQGWFDASQVEKAQTVFDKLDSSIVVNFKDLEYISSAGLGVLLKTQKRLKGKGCALKLINMNKHISDVFRYAGFDQIFEIE